MRTGTWVKVAAVGWVMAAGAAWGQVTREATFENLAPGFYGMSFTDPASGIRFRRLTGAILFAVNGDGPDFIFGGSHYLTGGVVGFGGMGTGVGFTADLPQLASSVSIDVIDAPNPPGFLLQGFDGNGVKVAEAVHPPGVSRFTITIDTPGYQIASFRTVVNDLNGNAYDNIRFTVPEPGGVMLVLAVAASLLGRRGR